MGDSAAPIKSDLPFGNSAVERLVYVEIILQNEKAPAENKH